MSLLPLIGRVSMTGGAGGVVSSVKGYVASSLSTPAALTWTTRKV